MNECKKYFAHKHHVTKHSADVKMSIFGDKLGYEAVDHEMDLQLVRTYEIIFLWNKSIPL